MPEHKKTASRRLKKNKTHKRRKGGAWPWDILFGKKPEAPAAAPVAAQASDATTAAAAPAPVAAQASDATTAATSADNTATVNPLVQQQPNAQPQPNVAVMGGKRFKKSHSSKKSKKSKK